MITDRHSYKAYRQADLQAYQVEHLTFYRWHWMDCLRFQLRLRKIEYLYNTKGRNPLRILHWFVLEVINHRLGTRLGFSIPKNVFGPGLCIVHPGTIVVNPAAKVGSYCRIHPGTCIGDYNGIPTLGDHVYIGPGAKLYGNITIGNNVAVGANAVVNKSFPDNVTIAGVPAKIISYTGAVEQGVFPKTLFINNKTENNG
ncbi:MAG: serine acetyltransferase [Bacteroidales bacterium]|nr:serine acetyltransferase [Bacteroidales bacterium]